MESEIVSDLKFIYLAKRRGQSMFHIVGNSSFKSPEGTEIYSMCKIESRAVIQKGRGQVIGGTQDEA